MVLGELRADLSLDQRPCDAVDGPVTPVDRRDLLSTPEVDRDRARPTSHLLTGPF